MGMGITGLLILLIGAVLIGVAVRRASSGAGQVYASGYAWVNAAVGALLGGYAGSELLGSFSSWGPEIDGLRILPAFILAVITAGVADYLFGYETRKHARA